MKTAEGMVEVSAPQVRDTPEPFVSAIRENLAGRTQALEDLELYARGLSTRDIEDSFTDEKHCSSHCLSVTTLQGQFCPNLRWREACESHGFRLIDSGEIPLGERSS